VAKSHSLFSKQYVGFDGNISPWISSGPDESVAWASRNTQQNQPPKTVELRISSLDRANFLTRFCEVGKEYNKTRVRVNTKTAGAWQNASCVWKTI